MRQRVLFTLVSAAVITIAGASPVLAQAPPPTTIAARGEATVKRAPDQAFLTVSTSVTSNKPDDARRQSADLTTSVISQLKGTGLASDAIRTLGFDLSPNYAAQQGSSGPRISNYTARNTIEVRVDDLDRLPKVIDTVMAPKNSGLSIDGPRFDLKDRAKAEEDALSQAVANALSRAKAMARGDGLQVLATTKIEEEGVSSPSPGPRPMYRTTAATASAPTPIEAGPIEITATVVVTVVAGRAGV
jgi:hypothetical protein